MKERLLVSITSGRYLKKKKQWVLVKLKLHNSKYTTKYVNGGEDVTFQKETFIFEINEDVYPAGEMEVVVETWQMLSSGESFAFATIPLAPITSEIRNNIANGIGPASISIHNGSNSNSNNQHPKIYLEGFDEKPPSPIPNLSPSSLDKIIYLKNKKQMFDLNSSNSSNKSNSGNNSQEEEEKQMCIILNFELVPENDSTTMKSLPLMFRWFPELPHNEQVISECYCTKQAKKMVGMSHSGTMYITQGYIGFRSPSHLAKNKKLLISFKDIKSIKKKIGSFYLPNAIQIRTSKKKYVFASFIHRSKAYKVLTSQWTLNGGGNNANDIEEDDDSNDDDTATNLSNSIINEDEEDEELSMINSSSNSSSNPLSHNQVIRNLSPLPKNSSNSNSISNSNSNSSNSLLTSSGKKRSLSIGSQTQSPNHHSPSRGTPTNPDSSLVAAAINNSSIKISIEIEDYQILGCTNIITITVSNDSLVKDLLEKLKSKLFTNNSISYEDQQQYILAKCKNKKSKRSSKRIMYSIDQLADINSSNNNNGNNKLKSPPSPTLTSDRNNINNIINNINNKDMMIIPTKSISLNHRSSNNKSNNQSPTFSSTGSEKKFYILENDKVISNYFTSSLTSPATATSELLYFKKQSPVKEINVIFELVEDKLKTIKLILSLDTKISDIFREISNYHTHKIFAEEYYLYQPKNAERGIVLHLNKTLRDYNISKSNSLIQVIKLPTFKSFIDKFKYFDKNDRNLLFQLVQTCFSNSLPLMKPQDVENPQEFLDKLQQKLNIDDIEAKIITKNLLVNSSYKDEGILVELKSRVESLLLDSNPYYNEFSFASKDLYETWKSIEIGNLTRVMRSVIFKEDFIGLLFINVLEAEGLQLNNHQETSTCPISCYLILSSGEKLVKTTTIKQESDPIWSESFIIKVKKPRSKLEILVMNSVDNGKSDECIGIIELSIKDQFEDQLELSKDQWFNITSINGTGKIHLSFEYQYQFQEYNKYLIDLPNRQQVLKSSDSLSPNTNPLDNPTSSINNQHRCSVLHAPLYNQLLNFILERQEDYKLSKFKFSPLASKRFSASSSPSSTPKFINPFDDTTNDDKEEDVWILGSFKMLLDQYSIRYGLSKSTTLVIQLSIMSERYSKEMKPSLASSTTALSNYSKNYILELEEVLESVYNITVGDDVDNIFLKSEVVTINSSILPLMEQIKYTVGRYYESFPGNKPRGALKSLVNSLQYIVKIMNYNNSIANNNNNSNDNGDDNNQQQIQEINFNHLLTKTIMVEQKKKFEENIAAMGFLQLDQQSKVKLISEISLMLVELISIIQEEVNSTLKYEGSFPIDVKITCELIDCWGSCILAVMEDFCSWAPYHPNILVLVKRILDYHNFTKSISMERFKPMPLKQLFVTYVYKLLKEIKSNLSKLCNNSIKKDDKRTLASITLGHSSSFVEFFNACDQSLKDFDSLMWLPDSFSFVQLLEVISSEVVHYVGDLKKEFQHFIEHTEIESPGKPVMFTLNVEPCIIYNNIEQSIKKLENLSQVINTNLLNNIKERKKQGETQQMDRTTKQCVEDSFKLCLDDTMKYINQTIQDLEEFLIVRIKNYLFYCFSSVLFSEPLVSKNSHYTEPVIPSDQVEINNTLLDVNSPANLSTSYNSGNNTPTINIQSNNTSSSGASSPATILSVQQQQPQAQFVSIQNSQSSSSGSLMDNLSNSNSNNSVNPARINSRYEKMILAQIKEFLTPKIEELYGKLREQSFKPFIKKLWCQIVEELEYLFYQRPKDKLLSFHKSNVVLNFDQIAIINSVLRELIVLFHRGGSGIATPILEEKLQLLRLVISLSEMDSTSLIDTYNQKKSFNGSNSNSSSSSSSNKPQPSKELIISILSTRIEFDKEARTFVNKINGVEEKPIVVDGTNIDISQIKVIPESEFIIDKYHCTYNGQLGILIISSRYLGFHNLLRQVNISIGNKISVALLNIVEVKKIKVALVFNAIQIKTNENRIYNFSGFLDRDTVYNDILHQIKVAQKNTNKKQQKSKK